MTSIDNAIAQAERHVAIAQRRIDFVDRMVASLSIEMTGTEWFEKLHSLRARGAQLGGSEKWDRVLRWIERALDQGVLDNRQIAIQALQKFLEATQFPRV